MLSILDYTLKSSFEGVLLLVILFLFLAKLNLAAKTNWIWAGTVVALGLAVVLLYGVGFWGNRELFEFIWLSGTVLSVSILVILGYLSLKNVSIQKIVGPVIFLTTVLLLTVNAIELANFPNKIFVQARSLISTDLILKVIGALSGTLLASVFGWTYFKSTRKMNEKSVLVIAVLVLSIILSRHLITLLQLGMALGYLPITPFLVSIVAPVINVYYPLFFYSLVLVVALQIFLSRIRAKAPELGEFPNPALKRKTMAAYRSYIRWLAVSGGLILVTGALLGVGFVESNKTIKLSPAVPVQASNGIISIPVNQVNDDKLHRFSYLTKNNVTMRFIVIDKGNGIFGIGLDACEICGQVGYYQRGDQVICLNCDVVINKITIGFPGGCNPIPFANKVENGNIIIKTADLDQKEKVFVE